MDAIEARLLAETTKVKSPEFAAVLGFFFPALGAFYTRKFGVGLAFLFLDCVNLVLAMIGIGILTGLLFRLIAAYLEYEWARQINVRALEKAAASRKTL